MGIEHCNTFLVFHKFFPLLINKKIMKLSTIFVVFAAAADAKKKKVKTPEFEAEKLKNLIEFVWGKWFQNCDAKHGQRKDRYKTLVDRALDSLDKCRVRRLAADGATVRAIHRRDVDEQNPTENKSDSEDYWWEDDEEEIDLAAERISKTDKVKATKQLANILARWGHNNLAGCGERGLTREKVIGKAKQWKGRLNSMGCAKEGRSRHIQRF